MQIETLRSQHLEYMIKGLTNESVLKSIETQDTELIKEFMPQFIDAIDKDLYRFKFRHVISIL